ncbi:MAG: hypothetical protein R3C09_13590 [Pirellulaceae bacterium]
MKARFNIRGGKTETLGGLQGIEPFDNTQCEYTAQFVRQLINYVCQDLSEFVVARAGLRIME